MSGFIAAWLALGIFCFFLARAAWFCTFGCAPITIGTVVKMLVFMWIPPIELLAAICWYSIWLFEGKGHSWGIPVIQFFQTELINPCKWFRKDKP